MIAIQQQQSVQVTISDHRHLKEIQLLVALKEQNTKKSELESQIFKLAPYRQKWSLKLVSVENQKAANLQKTQQLAQKARELSKEKIQFYQKAVTKVRNQYIDLLKLAHLAELRSLRNPGESYLLLSSCFISLFQITNQYRNPQSAWERMRSFLSHGSNLMNLYTYDPTKLTRKAITHAETQIERLQVLVKQNGKANVEQLLKQSRVGPALYKWCIEVISFRNRHIKDEDCLEIQKIRAEINQLGKQIPKFDKEITKLSKYTNYYEDKIEGLTGKTAVIQQEIDFLQQELNKVKSDEESA